MIATLNGKITEKSLNSVILETGGVGYELLISVETLQRLELGQDCKLQVYEHIRDNIYDLYGFLDSNSKALFIKLINVNGVGPKAGLNILGVGSLAIVKEAIATGNVKLIQTAPGVGKRVAERVVIDLKDKVGLVSSVDGGSILSSEDILMQDEAVQALVALGYDVSDAAKAVAKIDKNLEVGERVRLALKSK
ncbi:MAG TPA: Holliday junction branch migration protein RuvA [Candidatus Saccharimonadales bacterium]|jgi:Holliday junction DNA helicase RuvA|nr:Holliday junction branch migration protein RuvA [Candidatus Saccharimonadales bacterium]